MPFADIEYANKRQENRRPSSPHAAGRVYMAARDTSVMHVEQATVELSSGDAIVVEPGEAEIFLSSSPGYFHFVAHTPGPTADGAHAERLAVPRSRPGL